MVYWVVWLLWFLFVVYMYFFNGSFEWVFFFFRGGFDIRKFLGYVCFEGKQFFNFFIFILWICFFFLHKTLDVWWHACSTEILGGELVVLHQPVKALVFPSSFSNLDFSTKQCLQLGMATGRVALIPTPSRLFKTILIPVPFKKLNGVGWGGRVWELNFNFLKLL